MNERYNTNDLAERLASLTRLDKNSAEKFIDIISDFVINGIETNKSVKIIGLGTFKIILVRERESVHIQTGERFVIPAHHKLSFIPDKDMKNSINKPFAFLEPVEAENMPLSRDIIDIEEEEYHEDVRNTKVENTTPASEQEIISEDILPPEISLAPEGEIEIKQQYYDIISPAISIDNESEEETGKKKQKPGTESWKSTVDNHAKMFYENDNKNVFIQKKVPLWLWFLILPLLIVMGVGIGTYTFWHFSTRGIEGNNFKEITASSIDIQDTQRPLPLGATLLPDSGYLSSDTLNSNTADVTQPQPATNDTTDANGVKKEKMQIDWLAPTSTSKKEEPKYVDRPDKEIEHKNRELIEKRRKKEEEAKKMTVSAPKEKVIPRRVRMTQGSSLRQIALEYYGDKVFWVYIYEYNKDIIKDYDHIPLGTELRLPSPKTYAIDPTSQSSVEKAHKKQSELYKKDSWDDYIQ
jgi:nucleoid DNA-binding protein